MLSLYEDSTRVHSQVLAMKSRPKLRTINIPELGNNSAALNCTPNHLSEIVPQIYVSTGSNECLDLKAVGDFVAFGVLVENVWSGQQTRTMIYIYMMNDIYIYIYIYMIHACMSIWFRMILSFIRMLPDRFHDSCCSAGQS
jgi:hypothetical protein